jgi:methionine-rich copper-binding protein CopC
MRTLLLTGALALAATSALAHAQLESASPPVGGTVSSPQEIRINFSEGVEPRFSEITLSGPQGAVPTPKARVAPNDNKVLVVPIARKLGPGVYTVNWRAVSVDTHRTQGSFDFTVK